MAARALSGGKFALQYTSFGLSSAHDVIAVDLPPLPCDSYQVLEGGSWPCLQARLCNSLFYMLSDPLNVYGARKGNNHCE